ncbi:hypothetical protein EON65_24745 [archaeon]|nr:MAG: hypothetical protein EON65_24745 [archaeon]
MFLILDRVTRVDPKDRTPIIATDWMREAEMKHFYIAMLTVLSWVVVDFGARCPGAPATSPSS